MLGRLGRAALAADDTRIEDVMSERPSTVRPRMSMPDLLKRMDRNRLATYPVTTANGKLVGLVLRSDLEAQELAVPSQP